MSFCFFKVGFSKVAGGPGSGVPYNNTDEIDFLEKSPLMSIHYRKKFMEEHSPDRTELIPVGKIKYKAQDKMVPLKVVRMMKDAPACFDKPVDVIEDSNGDYHLMDGHHRAIAAILMKKKEIKANVYTMNKTAQDLEVMWGKNKPTKKYKEREPMEADRNRPEEYQ